MDLPFLMVSHWPGTRKYPRLNKLCLVYVLLSWLGSCLGLRLEPNWAKYTFCEVNIILSPDSSIRHDLDGFYNSFMEDTIQSIPRSKLLIWSIIKAKRRLREFYIPNDIWVFSKPSYSITRDSTSRFETVCRIMLTSRQNVESTETHHHGEIYLKQQWEVWMRYGLKWDHHLLRLNSRTILLIVDIRTNTYKNLFRNELNTMYVSPFISFIIFPKLSSSGWILRINTLTICTGGCKSTLDMFTQIDPFRGVLYKPIHQFVQRVKPDYGFVNARIDRYKDSGFGYTRIRATCPPGKYLTHRNYFKYPESYCLRPEPVVLILITEKLNVSVEFGTVFNKKYKRLGFHMYPSAIIDVRLFKTIHFRNMNTYITENAVLDVAGIKAELCEPQLTYTYPENNVLSILLKTFDVPVWVLILASLAASMMYIKAKSCAYYNSSSSKPYYFDLVHLLFQGHMRKRDIFRITMTFSFFLIQFLFLLRCTELIITPAEVKTFKTITEMLNSGGQFYTLLWTPEAYIETWNYKDQLESLRSTIFKTFNSEIHREGLKGTLMDERYWKPVPNLTTTPSILPTTQQTELARKYISIGRTIILQEVSSSQNFLYIQDKSDRRLEMEREGLLYCHCGKKLYDKGIRSYQVFGRNNHRISYLLRLLLLESGVHKHWVEMHLARTRINSPKRSLINVQKINIMDSRTIAIFAILTVGLTSSLLCFFKEINVVKYLRGNHLWKKTTPVTSLD